MSFFVSIKLLAHFVQRPNLLPLSSMLPSAPLIFLSACKAYRWAYRIWPRVLGPLPYKK